MENYRKYILPGLVLVLIAIISMCTVLETKDIRKTDSKRTINAVESWLGCTECSSSEKERALQLGEATIPLLKEIVINGPTKLVKYRFFLRCQNIHAIAENCEASDIITGNDTDCRLPDRYQFCIRYLGDYELQYILRAFELLSVTGGADELSFLEDKITLFASSHPESLGFMKSLTEAMRLRLNLFSN